mmetsp:Transcript_78215/g.197473  ORF Transcript_78215/g.197473 Transcript_78215/m.197473 type:complete len:310 (+) Transcript_78215:168-1097(+)
MARRVATGPSRGLMGRNILGSLLVEGSMAAASTRTPEAAVGRANGKMGRSCDWHPTIQMRQTRRAASAARRLPGQRSCRLWRVSLLRRLVVQGCSEQAPNKQFRFQLGFPGALGEGQALEGHLEARVFWVPRPGPPPVPGVAPEARPLQALVSDPGHLEGLEDGLAQHQVLWQRQPQQQRQRPLLGLLIPSIEGLQEEQPHTPELKRQAKHRKESGKTKEEAPSRAGRWPCSTLHAAAHQQLRRCGSTADQRACSPSFLGMWTGTNWRITRRGSEQNAGKPCRRRWASRVPCRKLLHAKILGMVVPSRG